jgi:hypothetical protein
MGVDDLAVAFVDSFEGGDLLSDVIMQTSDVYTCAALVVVKVVIADMGKEVAVIEDANPR